MESNWITEKAPKHTTDLVKALVIIMVAKSLAAHWLVTFEVILIGLGLIYITESLFELNPYTN